MTKITKSILATSSFRLEENLRRIENCLNELKEDEVWLSANESTNSIGNLVLHLNGNISQYILSSLGGKKDSRERDREFKKNQKIDKSTLLEIHSEVVSSATRVIKSLTEDQLLERKIVQGFNMNGIEIIVHVVEHYSYHTEQIAQSTKILKNTDLGFYKDMDLNKLNY